MLIPYRTKEMDFIDMIEVPPGISVVMRDLRKGAAGESESQRDNKDERDQGGLEMFSCQP